MERPGLKRLLAEVAAGRVDIIVVYKVDRLTRALSDFAGIVDVLDEADASFVSVTQPTERVADQLAAGQFVRFHCDGDRKGKVNGWARLFLDGRPAGRFGNHRLGIDERWKADAERQRLSPAERLAAKVRFAARQAEREREKLAGHEVVAGQAVALLASARPADPAHPYLAAKRVVGEGIMQVGAMLTVPMSDADGRIWNVQRIYADGAKRFLKGGRIEGLFWSVGGNDGPLCIGEGVGTMSAVRRATGHAIAVAFNKDNLEAVARTLRARWPDRTIIVCADDDAHLVHNPRIRRNLGVDAARAAAAAIGASVALPPRSPAHV